MFDSIWINANFATMRGGRYGAIRKGALAAMDGKIAWIGARADLPGEPAQLAREVLDCESRWITPGLIDCHTQPIFGGNRAGDFEMRTQGASEEDISRAGGGLLATVRATREASEMELIRGASARLRRLMDEGVTTVEIKSGFGLNTACEMKLLRVARLLGESEALTVKTAFFGLRTLPAEFLGRADAYADLVCGEMLPAAAEAKLVDAVDAVCAGDALATASMRRFFEAARALRLPLRLHADRYADVNGAALAAGLGAVSASHLNYADEAGIGAMAAAGTVAVLLPGPFCFLREKRSPPVGLMRAHGVPIAIATDCNPDSSPSGSILLMLNLACTLFGLTPQEALAGVTCNAARALGMGASHGTLEVGKVADLALWDIEEPVELAYAMGENPCAGTVKNGATVRRRDD